MNHLLYEPEKVVVLPTWRGPFRNGPLHLGQTTTFADSYSIVEMIQQLRQNFENYIGQTSIKTEFNLFSKKRIYPRFKNFLQYGIYFLESNVDRSMTGHNSKNICQNVDRSIPVTRKKIGMKKNYEYQNIWPKSLILSIKRFSIETSHHFLCLNEIFHYHHAYLVGDKSVNFEVRQFKKRL